MVRLAAFTLFALSAAAPVALPTAAAEAPASVTAADAHAPLASPNARTDSARVAAPTCVILKAAVVYASADLTPRPRFEPDLRARLRRVRPNVRVPRLGDFTPPH